VLFWVTGKQCQFPVSLPFDDTRRTPPDQTNGYQWVVVRFTVLFTGGALSYRSITTRRLFTYILRPMTHSLLLLPTTEEHLNRLKLIIPKINLHQINIRCYRCRAQESTDGHCGSEHIITKPHYCFYYEC